MVDRGEVVGLLGRMGEGKSTLLKICAGLETADSGWVRFDGDLYTRPRLHTLAAAGMYYWPESGSLTASLTIKQHFHLIEHRFGYGDSAELIAQFDLHRFLQLSPAKLSGGEKQRAEFALAAARRPKCLLADEPFRGLDPLTAEALGQAFQILASKGCAIVVTGHEVRTLTPYLTSVYWLTAGTTYALGHPDAAWQHDGFAREYLGPLALDHPLGQSQSRP